MRTLLLDTELWDLVTDASGGIAVATAPYQLEQDVASAVRTFRGECYYDTSIGVPYFEQVLGHSPPLALMKSLIVQQALRVPGVTNPIVFVSSVEGRRVSGQIQFTDGTGTPAAVGF